MTSEKYLVVKGNSSDGYFRRSVVAKSFIKKGEVVIRERPLVSICYYKFHDEPDWVGNISVSHEDKFISTLNSGVFGIVLEKLIQMKSPLLLEMSWLDKFNDCCNEVDWKHHGLKEAYDNIAKILAKKETIEFGLKRGKHEEMLKKFARVWSVNSFKSFSEYSLIDYGEAMFENGSFFNHCCAPNCSWYSGEKQSIVIFALEDIEVGKEITISYAGRGSSDFSHKVAREALGFDCKCRICNSRICEQKAVVTNEKLLWFCAKAVKLAPTEDVEIANLFAIGERLLNSDDIREYATTYPIEFANLYCASFFKVMMCKIGSGPKGRRVSDYAKYFLALLADSNKIVGKSKTYSTYLIANYAVLIRLMNSYADDKDGAKFVVMLPERFLCTEVLRKSAVNGLIFPTPEDCDLSMRKEMRWMNQTI